MRQDSWIREAEGRIHEESVQIHCDRLQPIWVLQKWGTTKGQGCGVCAGHVRDMPRTWSVCILVHLLSHYVHDDSNAYPSLTSDKGDLFLLFQKIKLMGAHFFKFKFFSHNISLTFRHAIPFSHQSPEAKIASCHPKSIALCLLPASSLH